MNKKISSLKSICIILMMQFSFQKLNAQFTVYSTFNSDIPGDAVGHIAVDALGNKWHSTNAFSTVVKFDGSTWTIFNTSNAPFPDQCNVNAIEADGNNVWIGIGHLPSGDTDIVMFDGSNWNQYDIPFGNSVNVDAVCITSGGKKWFGTDAGAIEFDGVNWNQYNTINSGIPNDLVHAIKEDASGNLWFGTAAGLARYDGVNWTIFNTINSGIISNNIHAVATNGEKIYAGTDLGFSTFDGISWGSYNTSNSLMPENTVLDVAIDSSGNVWFTTITIMGGNGGLVKWDGSQFTVYTTLNSNLSSNAVVAVATEDCKVWVGTYSGGLCEICSFTGIGNLSSHNNLSIFPNPSSGNFSVEMNSVESTNATLMITDIQGRMIETIPIQLTRGNNSFQASIKGLHGLYLVEIISSGQSYFDKLIFD